MFVRRGGFRCLLYSALTSYTQNIRALELNFTKHTWQRTTYNDDTPLMSNNCDSSVNTHENRYSLYLRIQSLKINCINLIFGCVQHVVYISFYLTYLRVTSIYLSPLFHLPHLNHDIRLCYEASYRSRYAAICRVTNSGD